MILYIMNVNVRLRRACPNNVVSVFHVIHLSHTNSINPFIIADMNQSVLADVRVSLGVPKMIAKI